MSFNFTPLSDVQINSMSTKELLPNGIYPFIVREVIQGYSKTGNSMLEVKIGVIVGPKEIRVLTDYIVASEKMMFKLKHFCDTLGLEDKYIAGCIEPKDCINRSGKVKIGVEKGRPRDDGQGVFADRNKVVDYVKPEAQMGNVDPQFNDVINF